MLDKLRSTVSWCWRKVKAFCHWYVGLYRGRPWYVKTVTAIVSCIVAFFLYLGMVDINFLWLFGESPGYISGLDPKPAQASEIYSSDGKLIGKYFDENRSSVKYEDVNPIFFKELVDTEDERFYKHWGVDPLGMFAAAKDALLHHEARGASTITQQLAKNLFRMRTNYSQGLLGHIPGLRMLIVKTKEWIVAVKLETKNSKKEILEKYANTVDFGSNAYGIKTAAKTYFNTTPKNLTIEQAAVLVGMLKATTYYNPRTNPKNSLARRNVVLNNLVTHGDLSRHECDSLKQIPIELNFKVEENYDGQALYFREAVADYLKEWCETNGYDLYRSGLKIYTTIDTRMQKYAEDAAMKQMKVVQQNFNNHWGIYRNQSENWLRQEPWQDENHQVIPNFILQIAQRQPFYKALQARYPNNPDSVDYYYRQWKHPVKVFDYDKGTVTKEMTSEDSIKYMVTFMHCAMVAMEPETGAVRAWVGDIDFKTWKYDKVTAMRQPGSTFKLFVYSEAMNQGLTPCDKRRDEFISLDVYDKKKHEMTTWQPTNANGRFSGDSIPLKSAFARSINSIAVRLGQEMGIKNIINTAHEMGINSPLDEEPSLALGSSDVTLLEMVDAYSTVADNGMHHEPVLVNKIVDSEGKVVYQGPTSERQALSYKSAFLMQQMLMAGVREGGGTSVSLPGYTGWISDTDFGGKTGTSNNHSDAWFMCVTPHLVVGAWVGGEYRSIHFRTGALGQGSKTALPICGYFLNSVFHDPAYSKYHGHFAKPTDPDITSAMYNCDTYFPKKAAAEVDTTDVEIDETLDGEGDDMIELDENGSPKATEPSKSANQSQSSSVEQKKEPHKTHTREENVTFDNI